MHQKEPSAHALAVLEVLKSAGVEILIHYAGSTTRDDWECDQWRVAFRKGKVTQTHDYFTGIGHRKVSKADAVLLRDNLKKNHASRHASIKARYEKPVIPDCAGPMHALILDGQAINESFHDWASNYGYDVDSIKAFNTYNACCATGQKMRELFTREQIQAIQTALEGY